ncbi:MAG TPA: septal ring lytic transglycosylase RlpA family protein [Solirubrobacteraceae bacterium]
MRFNVKTSVFLLALMAAVCLSAILAASAFAGTGGSSAPSASSGSTPAAPSTHPGGIATWFGPGFYGKQTACGQTLTPAVVGVANRTLPCGTLVSVTYDGHSLTVPVLDRGPYGHHASWDLTSGAAQALGITETVRIATQIVGKTTNTPTLGLPPGSASETTLAGGALAG